MKALLQWITAGVAGLLLGSGLILSGMANPAKVVGFLDVTGAWDPSLGLVMGGGLLSAPSVSRCCVDTQKPCWVIR